LSATKPGRPSKPKPPQSKPSGEISADDEPGIGLDETLKRMLSMPPAPKAKPVTTAPRKRAKR
jgi:hypothetical protein